VTSQKQQKRMLAKARRRWAAGRRRGLVTHTGKPVTASMQWLASARWSVSFAYPLGVPYLVSV
jgi:hypothetical protein